MIENIFGGLPTVAVLVLVVCAMAPFIIIGIHFTVIAFKMNNKPFKMFTLVYWVSIFALFVLVVIWGFVLK